jgi:hypothetical protein
VCLGSNRASLRRGLTAAPRRTCARARPRARDGLARRLANRACYGLRRDDLARRLAGGSDGLARRFLATLTDRAQARRRRPRRSWAQARRRKATTVLGAGSPAEATTVLAQMRGGLTVLGAGAAKAMTGENRSANESRGNRSANDSLVPASATRGVRTTMVSPPMAAVRGAADCASATPSFSETPQPCRNRHDSRTNAAAAAGTRSVPRAPARSNVSQIFGTPDPAVIIPTQFQAKPVGCSCAAPPTAKSLLELPDFPRTLKTLDYVVIVSPVGGGPAQISSVPRSTGKGLRSRSDALLIRLYPPRF